MRLPNSTTARSSTQLWTGRVLSALAILFIIFDLSIKFKHIAPVTDSFARLGIPDHLVIAIATLETICLLLYLIPRSAVFGAILLTGYLGGATMCHVRVEDPLFSHILFPTYIGTLLWVGLYLRDARLRALFS